MCLLLHSLNGTASKNRNSLFIVLTVPVYCPDLPLPLSVCRSTPLPSGPPVPPSYVTFTHTSNLLTSVKPRGSDLVIENPPVSVTIGFPRDTLNLFHGKDPLSTSNRTPVHPSHRTSHVGVTDRSTRDNVFDLRTGTDFPAHPNVSRRQEGLKTGRVGPAPETSEVQ